MKLEINYDPNKTSGHVTVYDLLNKLSNTFEFNSISFTSGYIVFRNNSDQIIDIYQLSDIILKFNTHE